MSGDKSNGNESLAQIWEDILLGRRASPARDTKFKPGQSGNPKGRPRRGDAGVLSLADQPTKLALIHASKKKLQVRQGDRSVEMNAGTALVFAAEQTALRGSPYMQHRLLEIYMKLDKEQARECEESRRFWTQYKEICHGILDKEREADKPLSNFLPHPDDILLDSSGAVRIAGPLDDAEQKSMEQRRALRDLLILQDEWDCRSRPAPCGPRDKFIGSAYIFAHGLDRSLPPRLRHTDVGWFMASERAYGKPNRELLKTLYRGWRSLGHPYPRGHRFPSRERAEKLMKFAFALFGRLPTEAASTLSQSQLQNAIVELLHEHGL